MMSSEGRGFGLPKLPSTTKQPVFSGHLDFQIVRDEGEALPSPCSDAKDFWPLDLCLPSTSLLDCPRAGAEHKTCDLTKTFRQLGFKLWRSDVTQGWGA